MARTSRYSLKGPLTPPYNREGKEFNSGAMRNWPATYRPHPGDDRDTMLRKHHARQKIAMKETASRIRPLEQTKRHAFVG